MDFPRIEQALKISDEHLSSLTVSDATKAEIESYFVSALTLLIISEYEQLIESIFGQRADLCSDPYACSFIKVSLVRRFRSPDLEKLTKALGHFGNDYRDNFSSKVINTDLHAAWDNIMRARQAIVHKSGTLNLTFSELTNSYKKTKEVLEALRTSMGLP